MAKGLTLRLDRLTEVYLVGEAGYWEVYYKGKMLGAVIKTSTHEAEWVAYFVKPSGIIDRGSDYWHVHAWSRKSAVVALLRERPEWLAMYEAKAKVY